MDDADVGLTDGPEELSEIAERRFIERCAVLFRDSEAGKSMHARISIGEYRIIRKSYVYVV